MSWYVFVALHLLILVLVLPKKSKLFSWLLGRRLCRIGTRPTMIRIVFDPRLGTIEPVRRSTHRPAIRLSTRNIFPLELDGTLEERSNAMSLGCLKTLEFCGFVGRRIDLEFATHVIGKAVALELVVIDFKVVYLSRIVNPDLHVSKARALGLREILPPGAKLVLKE